MGNRPRDSRIAVKASPVAPIVAPYADPGPLYVGTPDVPTVQTTDTKLPINVQFQDVRDVPIFAGFDFRKRVFCGV